MKIISESISLQNQDDAVSLSSFGYMDSLSQGGSDSIISDTNTQQSTLNPIGSPQFVPSITDESKTKTQVKSPNSTTVAASIAKVEEKSEQKKSSIGTVSDSGAASTNTVTETSSNTTDTGNTQTATTTSTPSGEQLEEGQWGGLEDVPVDGDEYVGDELYTIISSYQSQFNQYIDMDNGQRISIESYFVPKFMSADEMRSMSGVIELPYKEKILSLSINDSLATIGLTATAELVNDGFQYDSILQKYHCFYFAVNITLVDGGKSVKMQTYLFDIESTDFVPPQVENENIVRLQLIDSLSAIMKQHSIASVIKMNKDIVRASSYKEVCAIILMYLKRYIYVNNSIEVKLGKMIRYINESSDMSSCVENTFARMPKDTSIYDALLLIQKEGGTAIQAPDDFKETFAYPADVCMPFFFRDEFSDPMDIYMTLWENTDEQQPSKQMNINDFFNGKNTSGGVYVERNITLRDMYMPFGLAFNEGQRTIYESFNPSKDANGAYDNVELQFACINGRTEYPISNFKETLVDIPFISNKFKNILFVSNDGDGSETALVYFNWIYYWFVMIMLNGFGNGGLVASWTPEFLLKLKNNEVDKKYERPFEEANAIVRVLHSEDPVNESMIHIGKTIASLVLLNTMYEFDVAGNIFRRPNEIIKLGKPRKSPDSSNNIEYHTDIMQSSYTLTYVVSVTHTFNRGSYSNHIISNVIYEKASDA